MNVLKYVHIITQGDKMGIKFKTILLSITIIITALMFGGCDLWSYENTATRPPITDGVTTTDKNNDSNFDESDEDLVDDDALVDSSQLYEFLDGVKVAYDGTENKLELLNETNFYQVFDEVANYLNDNTTIDCQKFVDENSYLNVNADFVSRVVWLYNYVNEYKTLARMILTSLAQNYGYGIDENFYLFNNLYNNLYYYPSEVLERNKNTINAGVYETTNSITVENTFAGLGEAIYKDETGNEINFNTASTITFNLFTAVPSKAYKFLCNLGNNDGDFVFVVENPYYDSNYTIDNPNYIPNHILSWTEVSFVGKIADDGTVNYALGSASTTNEPLPNDFANDYVDTFDDYLALRLLETHLKTQETYNGEDYELIDYMYLLDLYESWSNQVNKFGFDETFFDENGVEYNTIEEFTDCVIYNIVGENTINLDNNAGAYSRDLYNNIAQIVSDCVNAKVVFTEQDGGYYSFDYENGQNYFMEVFNIEVQDYTAEQLFNSNAGKDGGDETQNANSEQDEEYQDNIFYLPDEEIYSIVVMLKPDFEPVVMQSIMLMMLAPNNELDVELSFRYVVSGQEKIYDKIDYQAQSTPSDSEWDEELGEDILGDQEITISNSFDGHLPKYDGQEVSMEFADQCLFVLENYNTPNINTIKNQEILIEKFENNLKSPYANSLNVALKGNVYKYNSEFNNYYYNETAENCDFVEINFNTIVEVEDYLKQIRLVIYDLYFDTLSSLQEETA